MEITAEINFATEKGGLHVININKSLMRDLNLFIFAIALFNLPGRIFDSFTFNR